MLRTNKDFSELRNLDEIRLAVEANSRAKQEVKRTEKDIQRYLTKYVESYLFTLEEANEFLSEKDKKLMCMNSEILNLHKFYKRGMSIPDLFEAAKAEWIMSDKPFKLLLDTVNKKFSRIYNDRHNLDIMLVEGTIYVKYTKQVFKSQYRPGQQDFEYTQTVTDVSMQIDTATNTIIKNEKNKSNL